MSDLFSAASLSVSELNALAKRLLEDNLTDLWIAGEVSNLTRAASGHYYFSLKDDKAQVRCVMFKGTASRLETPLKEGGQIEVSGRVSLYEARGEFQITVTAVRLKGLGLLYAQYEALKQRLQAEGLFDEKRKQPLPPYPERIGIVTSTAAAALRDVLTTLKRRHPGLHVIIYPTPVQGAGSAEGIAQAIRTADSRRETDVLIVCRGGGSMEDLWSFNEEAVVRAVAECTLPVVSGVGHETDFTLTDFAADRRAPTPTAAAEMVSPDRTALLRQTERLEQQLRHGLTRIYAYSAQALDIRAAGLLHPRRQLMARRQQTEMLYTRLHNGFRQNVSHKTRQAETAALAVARLRPDCRRHDTAVARLQNNLSAALQRRMAGAAAVLHKQQSVLEALSPQRTLERGYSVVSTENGTIIRDAADVPAHGLLSVRFARGRLLVRPQRGEAQSDLFDNPA